MGRLDMLNSAEDAGGRALVFRSASIHEIDLAVAILTEAAEWSVSVGNLHSWPRPFPSEIPRRSAARGELFLVESPANGIVATITLQWEDPLFWGDQPPVAGYVHRLAVRRALTGKGLGTQVLDWAGERVRQAGRKYLRLDCAADNPRLKAYYEAHGFRFISEIEGPPIPFRCALFEKPV